MVHWMHLSIVYGGIQLALSLSFQFMLLGLEELTLMSCQPSGYFLLYNHPLLLPSATEDQTSCEGQAQASGFESITYTWARTPPTSYRRGRQCYKCGFFSRLAEGRHCE